MKTERKPARKMAEKLALSFTVGYEGMAVFRHCSRLFRENSRPCDVAKSHVRENQFRHGRP